MREFAFAGGCPMKALILTWTGAQDQEVIYPYYRLLGAGFDVVIAADKRAELGRFYGIFGVNMPCHVLISDPLLDEDAAEADLLVIPGGVKALEKLRQQQHVLDLIATHYHAGKLIASTCHGAQMLISAKITKGHKIASYPSIKDDVINSGAEWSGEPVVVSGSIISSPHYDHMGIWLETVIHHMKGPYART